MSDGPSLYRRHRPRTFADVVGQEHVVRTLRNAVEQGNVHHAYLFVGSRGTGKTSMAKILAACLNCEHGPTTAPCGSCASCTAIASATSLDVIEMDAASNNSVDDIRDLREKVAYAPVSGRHKVYILDEAHMLSQQAWNAFLKTLEEPPPRTIFVLATTEAQKVLPTVVDRCHRFDFGRPSVEQVIEVCRRVAEQEQIEIDDGALALLARHATGSFRDALGTLEQLVTYVGGRIEPADVLAVLGVADAEQLFGAVEAIVAGDPAEALRAAARLADSGRDPGQVLRDLEVHGRELLTVQILGEVPAELQVTADRDRRLAEQANALSSTDAVRLLELVSAALESTTNGSQARIQLELALVKAAAPEVDPSTKALLARIERLEASLRVRSEGGLRAVVAPGDTPAARAAGPGAPSETATARGAASAGGVEVEAARIAGARSSQVAAGAGASPPAVAARAMPEWNEDVATQPALDLNAAVELWPAVVDLVKDQNAMLAALLKDARPVGVTDRELSLAFPPGAAFLKRKAEQDDHRRAAADAVQAVSGRALALCYELSDDQVSPDADSAALSGEELVQRFLAEFDAEELLDDDDPDDEGEAK
ncbi:MAG TPA: DNA polymerase III subunit gamma/tau [Solirubrobacteraceae bacterium]